MLSIFLLVVLAFSAEGRKSYTLSGPGWNSDIYSCASSGAYEATNHFELPNMSSVGLKYEELDNLTTVIGYFKLMEGHTKAVQNADLKQILLNEYKDEGSYKQFIGRWGYSAVCGWATQETYLRLTVKFMQNGNIKLTNYVYAGSWGAVTCASTKSHVDHFDVIY